LNLGGRKWQEAHNLYTSPNIIRVMKSRTMRWVGHVAGMGGVTCLQNFIGRSGRRWEDNIRMDLRETEWEVVTGLI